MTAIKSGDINFEKYPDGLVPAVVQDARTHRVLMLGFMNSEALQLTKSTNQVTFYSRSRNELWIKGETSGNFLMVEDVLADCDADTLLIKATPAGPVCHSGSDTCFSENNQPGEFLLVLEQLIRSRKTNPIQGSYTSELFAAGLNRIAQKLGEESFELVIEAKDENDERVVSEAADLLYHLLVLLAARNVGLSDVIRELETRNRKGVVYES